MKTAVCLVCRALRHTSLQELYASNNDILDISVLSDCVSLSVLDISSNQVKDVSVLAGLPELTYFLASDNQIEVLPAFDAANCKLVRINVNNNKLTDLSPLKGLPSLNYILRRLQPDFRHLGA